MSNVSEWNVSAASNTSASPNGAPEGMAPSGVNDTMREMMAATARWYQDTNGSLESAGSSNAYTLTTNNDHATLADQSLLVFRADRANTGAATLNVDSLGAKSIRFNGSALVSGQIVKDVVYGVAYNATDGAYDLIGSFTASAASLNTGELDDARLSDNVPLKNASNTFAATQVINANLPVLRFVEADADTDEGTWDLEVRGGNMRVITRTTALELGEVAFDFQRNGTEVTLVAFAGDEIDLTATTLDFNGNADISGTLAVGGNVTLGAQDINRSIDTDAVQIFGGTNGNGAFITLFGGTHASQAKNALLNADQLTVNDQANANNFFQVKSTLIDTFAVPVRANTIANSTSETLVAGQLHFIDANASLPNLTAGQWIQVINDSASAITISKNASDTTYWSLTGAAVTTSFSLAARGKLTAVCNPAGTAVYVSGPGITSAT